MTVKKLKIADDLALPLDAATQTFAFIARKGAGKTYTAGKLVELLLEAGVQVVVLDTVGNWYGLRLAADGKSPGFDVPVLGGLRGDIPLEAAGGALIADIVVETGRSLVIDMSQFSLADRKRFATTFGERLWQAKKAERHPTPVHLVIEESQLIVPQDVRGDSAKMVGVFEEIIRLGRNYGIGVSMITQRPQSVNKEVLNQTECLFVGQVNGAQERDALKKWITHQGMDVHLVDELPGLKIGTFYVWSPQWLNLLQRVRILPKQTYDASATPKVGDKRVQRDLKPLDLTELQERLKATIEKAKAEDPRELRKQIAELKKQAADFTRQAPVKVESKPLLTDADRDMIAKFTQRFEDAVNEIYGVQSELLTEHLKVIERETQRLWHQFEGVHQTERQKFARTLDSQGFQKILDKIAVARAPHSHTPTTTHVERASPHGRRVAPAAATSRPASVVSLASSNGDDPLTNPEQRIVDAIAWLESIGVNEPEQPAVAFLANYKYDTGGYNNPRSRLNQRGLVEYRPGNRIRLTDAGRARANTPDAPLTVQALRERVMARLPNPEQRVLQPLLDAYPKAIEQTEHARLANYAPETGGFNNPRSRLRTLGLIDYPQKGYAVAKPLLFLEER